MKERILQFLQSEQISSTQFADAIGVQRSSISHILSGRNNPSFDFIRKMLQKYTEIRAEWLILGEGEMYKRVESRELFDDQAPVSGDVKQEEVQKTGTNKSEQGGEEQDKKHEINDIERVVIFYRNNTFTEYHPH